MHGHHPHLVARELHVALDLGASLPQPGQKALQRRRLAPLIIEGEIEEFVERIVGLGAKPRQETPPAAAGAKDFRVERKRRLAPGFLREVVERRLGCREYFAFTGCARERVTQRCAAAIPGELEQLLVLETE